MARVVTQQGPGSEMRTFLTPQDGGFIIELSANLAQNSNYGGEITTNPIEGGGSVADHVVRAPIELEIDAIIVDNTQVAPDPGDTNPVYLSAKEQFDLMMLLFENSSLVTVSTPWDAFSDMVITEVNVISSPELGSASDLARFNLRLVQVNIVRSKNQKVTKVNKRKRKKRGKPAVNIPTGASPTNLENWERIWDNSFGRWFKGSSTPSPNVPPSRPIGGGPIRFEF